MTTLGCSALSEAMRGYAATPSDLVVSPPADSSRWSDAEWGAFYVLHGDFGTLTTDNLQTNALPWKLVRVLSDVVPEPFFADGQRGWTAVPDQPLRRFGISSDVTFVGPKEVHPARDFHQVPEGYALGTVRRSLPDIELELASANCTLCHGGRLWDSQGNPTDQVYWGVPNHSIDFDSLIDAIIRAIRDPRATDEALLAAMDKRFPTMASEERESYRRYVLPGFRKAVDDDLHRWGALHPWHFGGPGNSHGVAILHDALVEHREKLTSADFPAAYTKVPNVYGVTEKRWLLIDGCYFSRPADNQDRRFLNYLVGFLPVLGASTDRAIAEEARLAKVLQFLKGLEPPAWPGPIDHAAAERGREHYARRCASCHGDRGDDGVYHYTGKRVPLESIGTDPTRANAIDPVLAERFNQTGIGRFMTVEPTHSYVAPPLHGIWANAPYLHNGSVPTLWHLLTPSERPARFWVGGHRLDLKRVGIDLVNADASANANGEARYPAGYVPWSEPRLVNTTEPGHARTGHELPSAGLTEDEKWDLIEYLKEL